LFGLAGIGLIRRGLLLVWLGLLLVCWDWFGLAGIGLVWLGLVWFGGDWFDLVWLGLVWFGWEWFGLAMIGLVWLRLVWFGKDWFGLAGIGLDIFLFCQRLLLLRDKSSAITSVRRIEYK